jgi:hypothetical protein
VNMGNNQTFLRGGLKRAFSLCVSKSKRDFPLVRDSRQKTAPYSLFSKLTPVEVGQPLGLTQRRAHCKVTRKLIPDQESTSSKKAVSACKVRRVCSFRLF